MIRVRLQGRMGNQMFQYAFALYAAKKNRTWFSFDVRPKDGFCLAPFHLDWITRLLGSSISGQRLYALLFPPKKVYGSFRSNGLDEDWSTIPIDNNTYFIGYFQDARFATTMKPQLMRRFQLTNASINKFQEKFPWVFHSSYVVIHIRMGDYQNQRLTVGDKVLDWAVPISWYQKAFEQLDCENKKLVIISDDLEAAKSSLSFLPSDALFPEGTATEHFQFLLHAEACIISNSSFAWWGAFLNDKTGKQVLAPRHWVGHNAGFEFPKGIMTKEFTWV